MYSQAVDVRRRHVCVVLPVFEQVSLEGGLLVLSWGGRGLPSEVPSSVITDPARHGLMVTAGELLNFWESGTAMPCRTP
jgi:hypothetical protein